MVTGGIQEVELIRPIGFLLLLDQFCRFFQEYIVIDPHPCFRCIGAAEIRGRHHLVEPAGRGKLVKVPVGHISPVPIGGMVAQLFQLPRQSRWQIVLPEAFLFIQFQPRIEDPAHQTHNGRPGNDAGRKSTGQGSSMGILHQLFSPLHQVQTGKLGIEELLEITLSHKEENMGGFGDPGPLGRPPESIGRVGQLVCQDFFRKERLDGRQILGIRVLIGGIQLVLHHLFQSHQIVHRGLGKENVLFHHAGDGVPFRLIVMPESPSVAEPVKSGNGPQENHRVVSVMEDGIEKVQVLEAGQLEQTLDTGPAQSQVGQDAQKDPGPVVLMEENVHQVVLFRFGPQLQSLVKDIMEMLVEQHLSRKGQVKHQAVDQPSCQPQGIPPMVPHREKSPGQAQEDHRDQKDIGVEIHPPPETIPETVPDHRPLALQAPVRIVHSNENQTKNSTQDGKEQKQLSILLQRCVE